MIQLAKGLGALALMLGVFALALNVMTGTAAGAASLLVASAALVILANVLEKLGNLSVSKIVTGLAAMAGVFIVLGLAAYFLVHLRPRYWGWALRYFLLELHLRRLA